MKISKLIPLILLFASTDLLAQLTNTKEIDPLTLEKERKIRSKNNISESFEYTHQLRSKDSILKSHKTFNKNGELLTKTVFSSKQDTINHVVYEYEGEKVVKSHILSKDKNKLVFLDIRNYSYDKNGNNIDIQFINKDGDTIYQKIDYYSTNLKKTLQTKWQNKTDFSITEEYFYSNNNLIKTKTYLPNEKLFSETAYQYDNLGNLVSNYRLVNEKKDIINFYKYDRNNNLIESSFKILSNNYPNLYKTKYEYDKNKNVIKEYHTGDKNLKSVHTISYKKFE
ncbi:hypothetical protein [Flavobacterium hydrophilum]|uniref:Sugar-binding protein n=1 Tax=Flavobacterium hydrophilum TaxID=2211445 RepID=A0A2V4CBK7_9FLAO|nr:hypothetical protein [Flavobacterium hydrophilum]PXY43524.1 hypothetical protein DMB68_18200 [Flavobacterium hydrophilum]